MLFFYKYILRMIGISLPTNPESRYDYDIKRQAISKFMFNMAFENSVEDGYVTEKAFDALLSGLQSITSQHLYLLFSCQFPYYVRNNQFYMPNRSYF